MPEEEVIDVSLDDIDVFSHQSREQFDEKELNQLAENIKANGQLQPGVAWLDQGRQRYILICGERRFRALKLAGRRTMAVKVMHGILTQSQMLQINLSENVQRASLNPIERGRAFHRLMQLEDITARDVAARMQVSDATVSRDLSLLDLPEALQKQVISGELPASVAAYIARVDDDQSRRALADKYAGGKLTRAGVASEVNHLLKNSRKPRLKNGGRLSFKLDGMSLTLTAVEPLTKEMIRAAAARLQQEARQLDVGTAPAASIAS